MRDTDSEEGQKTPRKRDAAATRKRILDAAREDFAEHGFTGARVDRIANASGANVQMIYRYFGSKDELYLAVLADIYVRIRQHEQTFDLTAKAPLDGIRQLVEFTYDYMRDHPEFVALIRSENVSGGQFVRRLPIVSESTQSLIGALTNLLERGYESGDIKVKIDAKHLYVTILSLCIVHQSQRSTLSVMLEEDLGAPEWLDVQRRIAVDVVHRYLSADRT
ncbi:TetR/AcrR family transcriptional regulator [Falsirhodobacter algicola]|uniref:TetR family transcriptional regulator n=1 Tax=Falsirhodobacter algicola TaxID=2692330 RepID=A0A8J8MTC8_9RHOB|nr:TetR/AcrR family transcriptional regulator [Falsirhodobacter algicola]QUS36305.1 TetR family transcriptional regulator [Falsirhodobacter algicola]